MINHNFRSPSFTRLVNGLKKLKKTVTTVESSAGGVLSSSIMSEEGSSAVFYGGSVAYNTRKALPLLLSDKDLHSKLVNFKNEAMPGETEADVYIRSKLHWTAEAALAFCKQMNVDYAIAEGGAAGPTFRPKGLDKGFAAIAIAGRDDDDDSSVRLLAQTVVHSTHANRQGNMRLFADAAADLASDAIGIPSDAVDESNNEMNASCMPLDRATHLRRDEEAIRNLEKQEDSKYVIVRGRECLFASPTELALVGLQDVPDNSEKTFLGLASDGSAIFSVDLDDDQDDSLFDVAGSFADARTQAPLLNEKHNELALYATALSQWKKTHRRCSSCGSPLITIQGGSCQRCTGCGVMSWPRQDPSIIVLVTNRLKNRSLLARSPRHPPKMHTALAGFVEAGETFEQAVHREVFEETGVHIDMDSVSYIGSQPWPFPRSCMIGFHATVDENQETNMDEEELVELAWFDIDDVVKASTVPGAVMQHEVAKKAMENDPTLPLLIPPNGVLARKLIDSWLHQS